MVTITNRDLESNVFETVYDFLKLQATDSEYQTGVQPTITASYIDGDKEFPQIIVRSPDIGSNEYTFDRSSSLKSIVVIIDIYTNNDPSNSKYGNKDRGTLSDDVEFFLGNKKIPGVSLFSIESTTNTPEINGNKIYNKTKTFTYIRR